MAKKAIKKKYPCIESTLDIPYEHLTIRVWIDEKSVEEVSLSNKLIVYKIYDHLDNCSVITKSGIIDFIRKEVPHANAAQVIDRSGPVKFGSVAYFVDFSEDVHG